MIADTTETQTLVSSSQQFTPAERAQIERNMAAIFDIWPLIDRVNDEVRRHRREGIPVHLIVHDNDTQGYHLEVTCCPPL